jgi:histidinol-phosphate phosphatase family protein
VINQRIVGGYVRNFEEFEFLEGVLEALTILARKFDYCFVVTNQQGIAKGLMHESDLIDLHATMLAIIHAAGGRIDKAYYCPLHEKENPPCRKPNIGMGQQAVLDFPDFSFEQSVMVGDSISDIQFGINLGLQTVLIETKQDIDIAALKLLESSIDNRFDALIDYAQSL